MNDPSARLRQVVENALGQQVSSWQRPDLGLSAAERFSIVLSNGQRHFVKAAVDEDTEEWLRNEYRALLAVSAPFQPDVVAFVEPDGFPVLITEDLSQAYWPASHAGVTWREGDIDHLLEVINEMATIEPPRGLPALGLEAQARAWPMLMESPDGILGLGICDRDWIAEFGPLLVEAESVLDKSGKCLVHGDVRSDNICLDGDRVVLVDWSSSGIGNSHTDLAELLPTLHLEGGPLPYDVMPDAASWAAWQAGYLTSRALGGRLYEDREQQAPAWLIRVLTRLARINLFWAADCLNLPKPSRGGDGT